MPFVRAKFRHLFMYELNPRMCATIPVIFAPIEMMVFLSGMTWWFATVFLVKKCKKFAKI